MDNRDMLYTNRFIPHPLRPNPRQTGLRDPAASSMIRAMNARTRVTGNGASNQILPRISMFDQQMDRSKADSKRSAYQLRRTTVTIDSAFRQQENSFVRTSLFKNVVSAGDIESYTVDFEDTSPTNGIEMIITVTFTSLSDYQKERIEDDFDSNGCVFILENLPERPKTRFGGQQNLFNGIPLLHLNYNSKTGYPFHKVITQTLETVDGKMTAKWTVSLTKQAEAIGVQSLVRVDPEKDTPAPINESLTRVHDISMGYPYPQEYKINLGYTFKNVVAVRILNTVIPNVSFMINSSTRKNNKLRWINQCSEVTLPNVAVFQDGVSGTPDVKSKLYTDLHAGTYLTETEDTLGQVYVHNTSSSGASILHTLSESAPAPIVNMYAIKNITLHGGTYTPDSLATELEKELNRELVLSTANHDGFSEFSWYHGHFLPKPQSDDTFARGNSNPTSSRFFVSTNNKKRILSIQQCQSVYHANNYRVESNQNRVVQEGPLFVNAGVPYLYVRLPGTTVQSGDSVRIAEAFDILNIRDTEINREHTAIVCAVKKYTFTVVSPTLDPPTGTTINSNTYYEEHPFTLYEIVYQEHLGLSTFGRIIRVDAVSESTNQYEVWLEMMGQTPFNISETCLTQTSNVACSFQQEPEAQDNAHAGFNIKLARVPTRTILTGIGTEQLFIGTPVAFKFLFGMDENPGEVLGFHEDKSGMNNESIEFKKVESNTVDIHKINIVESMVLPTTQSEDTFSIEIQLSQECPYSVGDRVYMTNHMPHADIHSHVETFSFDFTTIAKSGDNTQLTVHRDSFQSNMCLFGKRPDTTTFMPFGVNDMVYIHDNEIEVPVYEKDVYIVTIQDKKTYSRGDTFEGYENAIVEESQYASNTFRVRLTSSLPQTSYEHIELARAQSGGQFLYRKQGIPDGVYKILSVDAVNGTIEVNASWQSVRAENDSVDTLFQKGIGRANMPIITYTNVAEDNEEPTNGILTLNFTGSNTMIDTLQENILYIHYSDTIPGQYYQTVPDTQLLKIKKGTKFPDNDTVTVRVCSSSNNTILNDHNGFTISSVDTTKTKVTIQVPKSHLPINITPIPEYEIAYKRHVDVDNQLKISYGKFGQMFMKEVDKPYIVSDNFMYLKCPTLSTIKNTETNALHDLFAKILLPGKTGSYVFDTFVSTPKVFNEHPLRELHELAFHFVNKHGDTVDFNEMDHSIVLEIVEAVERLERLNVQMSQ